MNAPMPNDDEKMRDALQRDAARVGEVAFDAALHYETMRRVRALAGGGEARFWDRPWPRLVATAVPLAVIAVAWTFHFISHPQQLPPAAVTEVAPASVEIPRATVLAYRTAIREGDATLFAALDRDAAELLPETPAAFEAPWR